MQNRPGTRTFAPPPGWRALLTNGKVFNQNRVLARAPAATLI
ncbi:hypothetical protein [Hymenobacter montanus]|nr:hypothetical protein [Hymenobacter montanus]